MLRSAATAAIAGAANAVAIALVLVGGDGLYSEALEGITRQQQRSAGVDIDDIDAELIPVNIPVGIIPTGTGNAVSRWANGITDVKTAVLNVIRGQQQRAQMSKVHSDGAFLRMSGVNVVYGMMSDMIKRSDELRWMKTKRYPYAMLRMVIGRKRKFNCRVQYKTLVDDELQNGNGSVRTEVAASSSPSSGGSWRDYDPNGQQFRGLLSFSCVPVDTEEDRAVQTIIGSSSHLIIDHGCFAPKFLKYLLNYISPVKTEVTSRKLVVLKDVTAFRIMLTENNEIRPGSWCTSHSKDRELERLSAIDGEVIPLVTPMLDVRVHGGFVPLYGCVNQLQNSNPHGGVKNRAFEPVIED
ncbi:ceramide kinase [Plakobranchus ocellatus]|uniref:Ceramide kinase n=1 Tax=Plakobranchus ocellatus TaxID=259542 RepID=A0AAV4AVB3_9GAST|nr:ceramide kinase [Plakobranchus ocellatus]